MNSARRASAEPVALSGYLSKMKGKETVLTSQWTRRFFALEGRQLRCYKSESAPGPSKVIDLLEIESVRRFEDGDHGVFSFVVKTPSRSFFLRAETKGDMKRWVRGLKEQQELWRRKIETGTTLPNPNVRKPKHYADFPNSPTAPNATPQKASTSRQEEVVLMRDEE